MGAHRLRPAVPSGWAPAVAELAAAAARAGLVLRLQDGRLVLRRGPGDPALQEAVIAQLRGRLAETKAYLATTGGAGPWAVPHPRDLERAERALAPLATGREQWDGEAGCTVPIES